MSGKRSGSRMSVLEILKKRAVPKLLYCMIGTAFIYMSKYRSGLRISLTSCVIIIAWNDITKSLNGVQGKNI